LSSAAFLALALTKALSWEGHMSVQVSLAGGGQHDLAATRTLRIALCAAAVVALLVVFVVGLPSWAL
jgi:hypothetical protein